MSCFRPPHCHRCLYSSLITAGVSQDGGQQADTQLLQELQDKLAHLEAVHAVAQESAMQSEQELQHARRLLSEVSWSWISTSMQYCYQ